MWLRRTVSLLAALILSGIPVAAQSLPSAGIPGGEGSIYTLHRIMGYTTMAGVLATGLLGWLAPGDLHGAVALGTTGLAAATTGVDIHN